MEAFKHTCGYGLVDTQPDCDCYKEFVKRQQEALKNAKIYSQEQIQTLFDNLSKKKEVPFRHTTIVDWDNIKSEFDKLGIK